MTVHQLSAEQLVPRSKAEVFAFFSRPENPGRFTPADLRFELTSPDGVMRAGLRLAYRLRPLLSTPTTWVSEITRYDAPDISGAGASPCSPRSWFRAKRRAESAVKASGIPRRDARPDSVAGVASAREESVR